MPLAEANLFVQVSLANLENWASSFRLRSKQALVYQVRMGDEAEAEALFLFTYLISGVEEKLRDDETPFFAMGDYCWMVPYHITW